MGEQLVEYGLRQMCEHRWGRELTDEERLEKVTVALEAGEDPNTSGGLLEWTCLMVAVRLEWDQVVAKLLSCPGINVNAKDMDNCTALHHAAWVGNVGILKMLMATPGILHNEKNLGGRTPIQEAWYGKIDIVREMAKCPHVDLDLDLPNFITG